MTDGIGKIEDFPYFKWRRDSSIQITLGLAGSAVFLAVAGVDAITSLFQYFRSDLAHLLLLLTAGLVGGSIILQFRYTVLALHLILVSAIIVDLVSFSARPSVLVIFALIASAMLSTAALVRMRSVHWAAFRTYCQSPEVLPKPPA